MGQRWDWKTTEHSKKRGSYLNELSHFKYWIEPAIGAIPLKDLRPIHLERLKKTLLEAGKIEGDAPTKAVKKLELNAGIADRRERFTFHSLRHTAASFLIQSGVDLYTVKEILGHGSIALTERYSHLADSALKEAANKMPDLTRDKAAQAKVVKLRKKS